MFEANAMTAALLICGPWSALILWRAVSEMVRSGKFRAMRLKIDQTAAVRFDI
ncbi:MAG: hypothetical protein WCC57_14285 [Paracoccaceae bacterium]